MGLTRCTESGGPAALASSRTNSGLPSARIHTDEERFHHNPASGPAIRLFRLARRAEAEIARSRQRAALAVNAELVQLYGRVGREILTRQRAQDWVAKVIDRLARDLQDAFPDMRGWSSHNLKYMALFA